MRLCKLYGDSGECKLLTEQCSEWVLCPMKGDMESQMMCKHYKEEPSWMTFKRIRGILNSVRDEIRHQTAQQAQQVAVASSRLDKIEYDTRLCKVKQEHAEFGFSLSIVIATVALCIAMVALVF